MASRIVAGMFILATACGGKKEVSSPADSAGSPVDGDAQAQCEPGRCLEDISRTIAEHRQDARACYDQARKQQPTLEGKVIINFAIDAEGVVGEASQGMQDNQIADPGLVDCVNEVVKKVRFAKSSKGKTTRAYHRFEFSPDAK
jgi:hypothetical protein